MESLQAHPADVLEWLISQRRSVRGFLPDPVPREVLVRIFAAAQQSPSNCNIQPWAVHVLSGEATGRMRTALVAAASGGGPLTPDYPLTDSFPGEYRQRQVAAAMALFATTGVKRGDVAARERSRLRNFAFFDAPHAAFILMPDWASHREALDCGIYLQTLMLQLTAHGLASCAQGALGHYADVVRQTLGAGDDMRVIVGLSFGYEDADHPANATVTTRAALAEAATFHD